MGTLPPAGPERPAGNPFLLFALLNAPVAVALGLFALLLADPSQSWRWAAAAVAAALAAAAAGNVLLARARRRDAARLDEAARETTDARRQLRSVFDTAADGILTFDEAGVIRSANPAAGRMFGYDPAEL